MGFDLKTNIENQKFRTTFFAIAAATAVVAGGCANIGGEDITLLPSSKVLDPLEVPPGFTPIEESESYVIPAAPGRNFENVTEISRDQFRNAQVWETFEQYRQYQAQQSGANLSDEEFRIAKQRGQGIFRVQDYETDQGKTRWIVYDDIDSLWQRMPVVLNDLGVRIIDDDDDARIFRVKGISPQVNPTFLQRIGVKEYAGKIDELHLRQVSGEAVEIVPKSEFLVEVDYASSDVFARQLKYYLLANYQVYPEGTQAPTATTVAKRIYEDADGQQIIELNETFDKAWVRVGRTLEAAGLAIVDLDRSQGVYLVSYTPVTEKKRSKWLFWRKKNKKRVIGDDVEYTVAVREFSQMTNITLSPSSEEDADSANELLQILYERLTT